MTMDPVVPIGAANCLMTKKDSYEKKGTRENHKNTLKTH